jgi:iron complex outermembrane receptor protein
VSAAVALAIAGISSQTALAQDRQANDAAPEEVVVTGSYIERPADRPQPVTIMSNEDIHLGQRQSVAEVFKDMPQIQATSAILNYNENYTSPTMTANLRGLGPRATLVLMNGRRQTVDGNEGTDGIVAVDINNLAPSIMIDRIEVLTDGASALYGSDAVAGVVNLITRNNFQGLEFKSEVQSIAENGTHDYTVGALFGAQGDDSSVVAGFEWSHSQALTVMERYSEDRVQKYALPTSFANPGSFWASTGGPPIPDPLCGSDELGGGISAGYFAPNTTACQMSLGNGRSIAPDVEQLNGLAVATHDFSNSVTAQVEIGFARARYDIIFGYGLPILPPNPQVPADNPGVIAAAQADPMWCGQAAYDANGGSCIMQYGVWTRAFSPAGDPPLHVYQEQDTYRVAGSLGGPFGDSGWDWNTTVTFSQNDSYSIGGDTIRERFQDALNGLGGPNCNPATGTPGVGDCLYFNPFANRLLAEPGDPNYNDPSIANWTFARATTDGFAELKTADFVVTGELGELPGGSTGLAVGVQTRSQEFARDYDAITEDGGYAFNSTPRQDFKGVRDTDALFAELVLYPTDALEVQLAARYEDYGDVSSTDPKVGMLWTPTDRLFFRATAGTSFRQPGEVQSFGAISQGSSVEPIGGETINARGLLVGNPNLAPETSSNYTIGVTFDVTDDFSIDFNYYDIDFEDLIVPEDGQVLLLNDIKDGYIDDPRIHLNPGVTDTEVCEVTGRWDPNANTPLPDGCIRGTDISYFTLGYINQEYQKQSGIDFSFDWRFESGASDWGLRLNGTYVTKFELTSEGQVFDALGSYNGTNFGFPNAQLRANLMLDWMHRNQHARATLHHTSPVKEDVATNVGSVEENFQTLDFVYDYTMPSGRSNLTLGILNVTDADPPIRDRNSYTAVSYLYEMRGRMYRLGFNWAL